MLPKTLALVDDDDEYTEFLAQYLRERRVAVTVFGDSNHLLADPGAYDYDFYVVDLMLPGIGGIDLIKVLRLRTEAGLLVISGRLSADVFKHVVDAGADMYLTKPVQFEQVALSIRAVMRRAAVPSQGAVPWRLDRRGRQLVAPDGARIDLSDADQAVMECFLAADGGNVTRKTLRTRLGYDLDGDNTDGLNATIYRLRRRIEKATALVVPLQSKSRVGYLFKAPLKAM